jgi:hypothetical protein
MPKIGVLKDDFYIDKNCAHVRNEKLVAALCCDTMHKQAAEGTNVTRKKKLVQFATMLQILSVGRPISDYSSFEKLFNTLKVPELPRGHWSDLSGYEILDSLSAIVLDKTREFLQGASFISLSADEVTTIDTQQWLSVYAYIVKGWERLPILVSLQKCSRGCAADTVKEMIISSVITIYGLENKDFAKKLVCFHWSRWSLGFSR